MLGKLKSPLSQRWKALLVKRAIYFISLIFFITPSFADTQTYVGSWDSFIYLDHFDANPNLLYGFLLQGRFRNQPGIFYQSLDQAQLGYRLANNTNAWVGYSALPTTINSHTSEMMYDQYLYQQIETILLDNRDNQIFTRTRILELKRPDYSTLGLVYRQLFIWNIFKLKFSQNYTPYLSDEIFLNMNNPVWGSHKTFNQNRFMLGVSFPCVNTHTCQLGYLNQYVQGRSNDFINHLLAFNFIM